MFFPFLGDLFFFFGRSSFLFFERIYFWGSSFLFWEIFPFPFREIFFPFLRDFLSFSERSSFLFWEIFWEIYFLVLGSIPQRDSKLRVLGEIGTLSAPAKC